MYPKDKTKQELKLLCPQNCSQMLGRKLMYRTLNYAPTYYFIASISVQFRWNKILLYNPSVNAIYFIQITLIKVPYLFPIRLFL